MSGKLDIPLPVRAQQRSASDPATSAWVSANAGSGKTHVLTQRVLRLLLAGVAPSGILCLTFTKTAAANMAAKVFETLAAWTGLDDAALASAIVELGDARAGPGRARLRPPPVRARHRDAGRIEDPDHPRLLRAPAASLSLRGQCSGRLSRRRRSRGRRCCSMRRAPRPSPTHSTTPRRRGGDCPRRARGRRRGVRRAGRRDAEKARDAGGDRRRSRL